MIVGVSMFMGVILSVGMAVMVVPVGMRMGMGVLMDMIVVVPLMIMGVGVGMGVEMFVSVIVAAIMPLVVSMAVGIVVHRSSSGIIVTVRKEGSPRIPSFFL
jgi:hypothetical protein